MEVLRLAALLLICLACPAAAAEKDYQAEWCDQHNGVMEFVLDDQARVDCLTDLHAVEFDFEHKWAESIGQALYYGIKTGKKPGVVLIVSTVRDNPYFDRLKTVARRHGITVWIMEMKKR